MAHGHCSIGVDNCLIAISQVSFYVQVWASCIDLNKIPISIAYFSMHYYSWIRWNKNTRGGLQVRPIECWLRCSASLPGNYRVGCYYSKARWKPFSHGCTLTWSFYPRTKKVVRKDLKSCPGRITDNNGPICMIQQPHECPMVIDITTDWSFYHRHHRHKQGPLERPTIFSRTT